jgi:hypothetical protein
LVTSSTLANVNSSAIIDRQPDVPNRIFIPAIQRL